MDSRITWRDVETVARTIYGEARGESMAGQIQVGWVIRNRWESGKWFGRGTLTEVCTRPWQFSCWNSDDPNCQKLMRVNLDDEVLQGCFYAALAALHGYVEDRIPGSTHYHVEQYPRPSWASGETPAGRIGNHVFYTGIN